jgi:hypothetical protein
MIKRKRKAKMTASENDNIKKLQHKDKIGKL